MDKNKLIGKENKIPWDIPEDLALFKKITSNNIVIMGRKTFESIGKPLPNRVNIILTKDLDFNVNGAFVFNNLKAALNYSKEIATKENKKIFIIGGSTIYKECISIASELHFSIIKNVFSGDTYFPTFDLNNFQLEETIDFNEFVYIRYRKK